MILNYIVVYFHRSGLKEYPAWVLSSRTFCMADLALRLLGKYRTPDTSRVTIFVNGADTKVDVHHRLGVTEIYWNSTPDEFEAVPDPSKAEYAMRLICDALQIIGQRRGWEMAPLATLFKKAEEADFKNEFFWKDKWFSNKSRTRKTRVFCQFDPWGVYIWAVIFDRNNREIARYLMGTEKVLETGIDDYFGKARWKTNNIFELRSKKQFVSFERCKLEYKKWSCRVPSSL